MVFLGFLIHKVKSDQYPFTETVEKIKWVTVLKKKKEKILEKSLIHKKVLINVYLCVWSTKPLSFSHNIKP